MANLLDDLWSQILRRPAEWKGLSALFICLDALLRKPKVCDLEVAIRIEEHVLRLEVSVDNSVLVETPDSFNQLSSIEASSPLTKLVFFAQMEEQLSSI
jgi:hypothetical protein